MKGNTMSSIQNFLIPLVLGVIAAGIVYAHLTGRELPLVSGPRATLIALFITGFAMCAFGILQVVASGRWASPLALVGYLLGASILVVTISTLTGWKLSLIQNETQAVIVVALLMSVKFLIGTTSFFLHRL